MRRAYWPEQEPGRESTAPFYEEEQRRERRRREREQMRGNRGRYEAYDNRSYGRGGRMEYRNPIGFESYGRNEYRMHGGGERGGEWEQGYAYGDEDQPLSQRDAEEWVYSMKLADGSNGPKWKFKEVHKLLKEKGWNDCDPLDMWVGMNALYSDLCKVNKKFGITAEHVDYWMEAAKAFWIEDEDAVEDKLTAYYNYVVE